MKHEQTHLILQPGQIHAQTTVTTTETGVWADYTGYGSEPNKPAAVYLAELNAKRELGSPEFVMNDQISTLPLVVWQPPWNQRMARHMAVKMRQCGHVSLRPFQQSIMRALLSGNPVVILRKGGRL